MKHRILSATLLMALLGACANRPETIKASFVSFEKYVDHDCEVLSTKMRDARATLAKHSEL